MDKRVLLGSAHNQAADTTKAVDANLQGASIARGAIGVHDLRSADHPNSNMTFKQISNYLHQ
jgi:hypothetical protein